MWVSVGLGKKQREKICPRQFKVGGPKVVITKEAGESSSWVGCDGLLVGKDGKMTERGLG